jgi:hypothetical protein
MCYVLLYPRHFKGFLYVITFKTINIDGFNMHLHIFDLFMYFIGHSPDKNHPTKVFIFKLYLLIYLFNL